MNPADWFLKIDERGNAASAIDRRRGDDRGWTDNNAVQVLVDGSEYFNRLVATLSDLGEGDHIYLTDWQGDGDELLGGTGTEVGNVLAAAARRGVDVRGLLWRSHPRQAHFAEQDNAALAKLVNEAGGEVVLDERVRRGGSHHQKLVIVSRVSDELGPVVFIGGIDLCHGRHDDQRHAGDPQAVPLDARYGANPPWHDVQLEVRGPAVGDLEYTFRERWTDPTPLDHRNPLRAALRRATGEPRRPHSLPPQRHESATVGTHAVQVLRTYPAKRPPFPFAPDGERSIARAYLKAFRRARRLVYLEDQYLWSLHAAHALADQLRREPDLHIIAIVPRYPDRGGSLTDAANRIGREYVTEVLRRAGGERVAIYDLENRDATPIYVHAKVCIIDDVLLVVGSDNLNRRSWTHDSEISCSVLDAEIDERAPSDPAGLGDRARRLARQTRLRLWREHLQRPTDDDDDLVDPIRGFVELRRSATALDAWHANGRRDARPPGHLRMHQPDVVAPRLRAAAFTAHHVLLDPDGRPTELRHADII